MRLYIDILNYNLAPFLLGIHKTNMWKGESTSTSYLLQACQQLQSHITEKKCQSTSISLALKSEIL